jgi:hypothetical protein
MIVGSLQAKVQDNVMSVLQQHPEMAPGHQTDGSHHHLPAAAPSAGQQAIAWLPHQQPCHDRLDLMLAQGLGSPVADGWQHATAQDNHDKQYTVQQALCDKTTQPGATNSGQHVQQAAGWYMCKRRSMTQKLAENESKIFSNALHRQCWGKH